MTAIESAVDDDDAIGVPIRSMSRNRRGAMPEKGLDENWLAQQLKRTRDQLDKKSTLCDELASELRKLEADLNDRDQTNAEVRGQLRAATAELKSGLAAGGAARAIEAIGDDKDGVLKKSQETARAAEARAAQLAKENEELKEAVLRERELHDEAMRLLKAVRSRNDEDVTELQQELQDVASGLEQKEEEILSIQFDMVNLQSNLAEQVKLVSESAEAFKQASEELAQKDERLEQALEKEKELLARISSLQELQEKVSKLFEELDGSRAANKALEEQMNAKVNDLQADRDGLAAELARLRGEGVGASSSSSSSAAAAGGVVGGAVEGANKKLIDLVLSSEFMTNLGERLRTFPSPRPAPTSADGGTAASSLPHEELLSWLREDLGRRLAMHCPCPPSASSRPPASASDVQAAASCSEDEDSEHADKLLRCEARINELTRALERSRLVERQALERAQEYRTSLALYREFGHEDFLHAAPRSSYDGAFEIGDRQGSPNCSFEDEIDSPSAEVDLPCTLMAINLDLGSGKTAILRVAPWHTRSDFEQVVSEFLAEHKVKPVFGPPLIRYLEQVEEEAFSFPLTVEANLGALYSQYG